MIVSGCTAGYRAVTATGLDRPYKELSHRARGESPPPAHAESVVSAPFPRFHPVPVRPVFLPEGAPAEVLETPLPNIVPPGDFPPPVDREIPARRVPADGGTAEMLVGDDQGANEENAGSAAAEHDGWRAVRRTGTRP
jgi:hypothetical protein